MSLQRRSGAIAHDLLLGRARNSMAIESQTRIGPTHSHLVRATCKGYYPPDTNTALPTLLAPALNLLRCTTL